MRLDTPSSETTIASALLSAPGWARMGITSPKKDQREEAARELARAILGGTANDSADIDQLRLSL